jgi:hypothetical protein
MRDRQEVCAILFSSKRVLVTMQIVEQRLVFLTPNTL